jgi:uncharacterized membrane protein YidH (DUF202 family)
MIIHSDDGGRGAQVERTVLSWNRVAIAVAANGALLMRVGFVHDLVVLEAFGMAVAIVGFALWALSLRRYSAIAGQLPSRLFEGGVGGVLPLATFVMLLSLIDLIVVVFAR